MPIARDERQTQGTNSTLRCQGKVWMENDQPDGLLCDQRTLSLDSSREGGDLLSLDDCVLRSEG
eukprot:scaffold18718_cov45-Attheya_sp.AAC.4